MEGMTKRRVDQWIKTKFVEMDNVKFNIEEYQERITDNDGKLAEPLWNEERFHGLIGKLNEILRDVQIMFRKLEILSIINFSENVTQYVLEYIEEIKEDFLGYSGKWNVVMLLLNDALKTLEK